MKFKEENMLNLNAIVEILMIEIQLICTVHKVKVKTILIVTFVN